jgi:hypothetical protein
LKIAIAIPERRITVKRIITAVAVLFLVTAASPLFAAQRRLVDDIVRMSRAGVSEESIISFVQNTRGPINLTADDLIVMTDAGLPKDLIKAVVDESAARNGRNYDQRAAVYAPSVQYYVPYYSPFYSPYYYDPFFYGPRFSLGIGFVGFRGGFHGGGGFHHGRH